MKTAQTRTQRLAWSLLASTLALSLMLGLSLVLSHHQVSAQPTAQGTLDLEIDKQVSQTEAKPDETLFYTITVYSQETSPLDIWVTDTLPTELTNVSGITPLYGDVGLANGVITWSFSMGPLSWNQLIFDAQVTTDITDCAEIENVAQLIVDDEIYTDAVTTTAVGDIGNLDNVGTYITVSSKMAEPGDVLDYTIWVDNDLPKPVPNAQFTSELPEGLTLVSGPSAWLGDVSVEENVINWSYDVPVLGSDRVIFSARVDPNISSDRQITSAVQFSIPGQSFTETVTISVHRRMGQLQATKSVYPEQARPTEYMTYTVHLVNTGDGDLNGLWMTDELPSEVNFVAGTLTATRGSFGEQGGVITWTSTTDPGSTLLLPLQEVTITYTVQITAGLSDNPRFTNTAQITGAGDLVLAQTPAQAITLFYFYFPIMLRNYPPVPTWAGPIPDPVNRSYIVSWNDIDTDYDHFVLQQSRFSDFATIENSWQTESTSRQVQSAYCRYYYRVRVDKLDRWGAGPWSYTTMAQPSPPAIVLQSIDNPDHDGSYTVSWSLESYGDTVDQYVLQEATDADFTNTTGSWVIESDTTSKAFQKTEGAGGIYYYRVRADDDDCWIQGPWSETQSTVVYIHYDFNSSCPSWKVRNHTGDDGPPGTGWFSSYCDDGKLKISVKDRWEHVIVSPLVMSPERPFEVRTSIYFEDRSWSSGYALIFGILESEVERYYRINVVYMSEGVMKYQVKRCQSDHCSNGVTISKGVPGADGSGYIVVNDLGILNGKEWNEWRVRRSGEYIRIYANGHLLIELSDNVYSGVGYFGLMVSTWEFQPATIWVDSYSVTPQ